jgi:hypothetical protein
MIALLDDVCLGRTVGLANGASEEVKSGNTETSTATTVLSIRLVDDNRSVYLPIFES